MTLVMLVGILVGFTETSNKGINVLFIVTQCVLVAILYYDNRKRQQSPKVIKMALWIVPIITLIHNGIARLVYIDAGMENLYVGLTYYGTGFLFIVVGNYLPKVKPNHTIGIRVVWTLQDEENWSATHRFSGRVWMAAGILCMLCGAFAESTAALVVYVGIIAAAAIVSVLYSYLFYKRKVTKL